MTGSPSAVTRRLAWWFFIAGVAAYMLLSAQALTALGIPYDAPAPSPSFSKIHPGSLLLACAHLLMLCAHGNPLRTAALFLQSQKLLAGYLICQIFVLAWAVGWHGSTGAANIIDTLIVPYIGVSTLMMFDSARRYRCLQIIVFLLVLNSVIGLGEALLHKRLIPYTVGDQAVIEAIFRPSALQGHPLTNSIITATLLPAVLYLRTASGWRGALALLLWISVLAFGGRTGFVLSTMAYGCYLVICLVRMTGRGAFNYLQITGGLFFGMLGSVLLALAVMTTDIGERIFESLNWDGSAAVRVRIWEALDYVSTEDKLVGIAVTDLPKIGDRIGLAASEAIENFWLVMFLKLGWIGFAFFVGGLACAFAWLWRSTRGAMRIAACLFFIIASSNNSLATKTDSLLLLMLVVGVTRRLSPS